VSLRSLLLSDADMLVADIMIEQAISVQIDTRIRRVAKLFFNITLKLYLL